MAMKREYDLICFDCGESFTAFSKRAQRCPTCRKEHSREMHKAHTESKRKLRKQSRLRGENDQAIIEIARKAREMGVSYGKYVAYWM